MSNQIFLSIHNISQIFKDIYLVKRYVHNRKRLINKFLTYIRSNVFNREKYHNTRIRLYHKSFLKGNIYQLKVKTRHRNEINSQIGRGLVSH